MESFSGTLPNDETAAGEERERNESSGAEAGKPATVAGCSRRLMSCFRVRRGDRRLPISAIESRIVDSECVRERGAVRRHLHRNGRIRPRTSRSASFRGQCGRSTNLGHRNRSVGDGLWARSLLSHRGRELGARRLRIHDPRPVSRRRPPNSRRACRAHSRLPVSRRRCGDGSRSWGGGDGNWNRSESGSRLRHGGRRRLRGRRRRGRRGRGSR